MIVYTIFTSIIGVRIGKVIFQNSSHLVAPSTFEASKSELGIDWSADMKISICTPDEFTTL